MLPACFSPLPPSSPLPNNLHVTHFGMNHAPKRKVLYFITKSNWGGAQRYVYDLATALPERGFETTVVSQPGVLLERLSKAGVRTHALNGLDRDVRFARDVRTFLTLLALLRKERPDILHLNSSKAGGLGALAGRLAGVPLVLFTAHGWAFNEPRPWWQRILIRLASWVTVLLCHGVITVSEFDRNQGFTLPFSEGKLITIHNGIATTPPESKERLRSELLPQPARYPAFWVGTIAELHRNKGIDLALQALAALKARGTAYTYIVIGEGEERRTLEDLAAKYGLAESVHFVGHRADAARFVAAFDVFLLPSRKEGFPYALLEAGAAGVPAVASAVGGIPELIAHNRTGMLVRPGDTSGLAAAVQVCAEDAVRRKTLGAALHQSVTTEFTLTRMLEEISAFYRAKLAPRLHA